jgi:hypothetical protein
VLHFKRESTTRKIGVEPIGFVALSLQGKELLLNGSLVFREQFLKLAV